jgi:predicted RNase H-like nuclease (RuvC/YqgF family)
MDRVSVAIEQLGVEAYQSSQPFFDKRSKALDQLHKDKLTHYRESEIPADRSIENLDSEVMDIQQELQSLADKNAKLLIQNSELKGRQSVFEDVKVNAANESKTVTQLKD